MNYTISRTAVLILFLLTACATALFAEEASDENENPFWGGGRQFVDIQKLDNLGHWDLSMAVTADGTLLANGTMRSTDGGASWEHNTGYKGRGAGFVVDETTGDVVKLDSAAKPEPVMFRSKDNGKTWTKEDIVRSVDVNGWLATPMHCDQGTTLKYGHKKGRLIIAARVFVGYDNSGRYDEHYSTALYSDDHGKTWLASEPFPFLGTGEAGLVELSDGSIYYNSRTHTRFGNRLIAMSYDGGETWTDGRQCDYLPDGPPDFYGCKGGLTRLPIDGYDILIFSQNQDPGGDGSRHNEKGRENLTIWASFDGGKTWPVSRWLDKRGGYSSLAAGRPGTPSEGLIYMLSHDGFFARFNLAWITNGRDWREFVNADIKSINPKGGVLPLAMYDVEVGTVKSIEFDLPQVGDNEAAYLFLEMADVDKQQEMKTALNNAVLEVPDSIVNDMDSAFAFFPVDKKILKSGINALSFAFTDNLNGSTKGYHVINAQFWIADKKDEKKLIDTLDEKCVMHRSLRNEGSEKFYTYSDDFSNNKDKFLRLDGTETKAVSTVHLFSSRTTLSARVKADAASDKGGLWLGVRYNLDDAYVVKCGYDFASSQWVIKDYYNRNLWKHKPAEVKFQPGKWYDLKIEAAGSSVDFYVDGLLLCRSAAVRDCNYGKIMLEADGVVGDFDDLNYRGTGRPQSGVTVQFIEGFGNGDMIRLDNGELVMQYNGKHRFMRSTDNGITWQPDTVFTSATDGWGQCGNIWRLKSGKILHVFQKRTNNHPNFLLQASSEISIDDGKTWTQGGHLHPQPGPYCTMNGKITQSSKTGRIFFPAATGGESLEGEKVGGIGIWYSDDDGSTWQESKNRLDLTTTGLNLQEGEVVELFDGRLMLMARSDTGCLMTSESTDGGLSWSTDVKTTPLVSTMCAFNTMYDPKTKEIFVFWVYDDTSEYPAMHQFPRERISLARSRDDMKSWEFLMDIDDFQGHTGRFMNLGMYVDDDCVYTMVNVFGTRIGKSPAVLQVTRIERDKLVSYEEFPTLH